MVKKIEIFMDLGDIDHLDNYDLGLYNNAKEVIDSIATDCCNAIRAAHGDFCSLISLLKSTLAVSKKAEEIKDPLSSKDRDNKVNKDDGSLDYDDFSISVNVTDE